MTISSLFPGSAGYMHIAMVVGEASGDTLGANLMEALLAKNPQISFAGIGGPKMEKLGFHSVVPQERLAVGGYLEVLKRLPELISIRKNLTNVLIQTPPDVFIGIDAPDFNLALEGKLREAGIPTIHYVSPSVWAWRSERVEKIGQMVDHVLCLFPMEPPIYHQRQIPATFVGHPLADAIPLDTDKKAARQRLGIASDVPVFAVLPGSRVSELTKMLPPYFAAMRQILSALPTAQFVIPLATEATRDCFQQQLSQLQAQDLPLHVLNGQAQEAMIASDVVLVTSGTATLEVALTKRPMVICYKMAALTAWIIRRKLRSPYVGLPNILLGAGLVPELLQDKATAENIASEVLRLYHDQPYQQMLVQQFDALHHQLKQDSGRLAADVVFKVIQQTKEKH